MHSHAGAWERGIAMYSHALTWNITTLIKVILFQRKRPFLTITDHTGNTIGFSITIEGRPCMDGNEWRARQNLYG